MSTAVTNRGVQVALGFNGISTAHFQMEQSSEKATARTKFIMDDRNNRASMLISNAGKEFTLSGKVKDDGSLTQLTALRALKKGDLFSITPTGGSALKCCVTDTDLKFSRVEAEGTISARYIVDIDPT